MTHTQNTCINSIALRAGKRGVRPAESGALTSVFKKISYRGQTKTKITKMQMRNTNSDIQR